MFFIALTSQVRNPDKPLKGEWDFKPVKLWSIDSAGDEVLARPGQLLAAPDGTLYIHDRKQQINHIFNANGKYIKSFGKRGEGPGEIKQQGKMHLFGNTLVIPDINRIHYFRKDGTFIKQVKVDTNLLRRNYLFTDENRLITVSQHKTFEEDGMGKITSFNLETGKKTVLVKFPMADPVSVKLGDNSIVIVVPALTPHMYLGYDGGYDDGGGSPAKKRLLYGMNNTYAVHAADLSGKALDTFFLDRAPRKITRQEKRKAIQKDKPQLNPIDRRIIDVTAGALTYFTRIDVHNGFIYMFEPSLDDTPRQQWVDIFSRDGRYLYRGLIKLKGDKNLYHPQNLVISGRHMYIAYVDENEEISIGKFEVSELN
jgi:hypothetical protein